MDVGCGILAFQLTDIVGDHHEESYREILLLDPVPGVLLRSRTTHGTAHKTTHGMSRLNNDK
jgi:hypothetical protein